MKRCSSSYVSREIQVKTIRRYPTYQLEWPKSGALNTSNAGKEVKQRELAHVADVNANGMATVERGLGVSYKTKHTPTI